MPVKIKKVKGGYQVSTPHGIKAKHTTLEKAEAQKKIIDAADAGHPFTGKKKNVKRSIQIIAAVPRSGRPPAP